MWDAFERLKTVEPGKRQTCSGQRDFQQGSHRAQLP